MHNQTCIHVVPYTNTKYIGMHTYTYVHMWRCTYICLCTCMYTVHAYVLTYVYIYIYIYIYTYVHNMGRHICMCTCTYNLCCLCDRSNTVQYANGSLALNSVMEREEGTYTCVAANQGGNASLSHQLDVKGTLFVYACNLCMWFTVIAL